MYLPWFHINSAKMDSSSKILKQYLLHQIPLPHRDTPCRNNHLVHLKRLLQRGSQQIRPFHTNRKKNEKSQSITKSI